MTFSKPTRMMLGVAAVSLAGLGMTGCTEAQPAPSVSSSDNDYPVYVIESVRQAGREVTTPADLSVKIPEGKEPFVLRVPTCPSTRYDITVVDDRHWKAMYADYQSADGCDAKESETKALGEAAAKLFDGEVSVTKGVDGFALKGNDIEMTLKNQ